MTLIAGGVIVFLAAFLGGVTGFGYALVAAPLLLLLGFPLAFVVTVNLAIAFFTRIPVVYRFRAFVSPRRVVGLVGGSVPGLWLGVQALTHVSESALKLTAGVVTMVVAMALWRSKTAAPPKAIPGAAPVAGFVGGFFGAATSLNGTGPILLLARDKASPRAFLADLGVYFVAANGMGLIMLYAEGALDESAFYPAFVAWLPASLAGSFLGTMLGPRLPEARFRSLTLVLILAAGALTAATAI